MGARGRGRQGSSDGRLSEAWRVDLSRGLRCLAEGDLGRASELFGRAHARAPERPEVCFALGRERLRQGKVDEAETLLRTAWTADRSPAAAAALARCIGLVGRRPAEGHAILDATEPD